MMNGGLDARVHAYRDDLADELLRDKVSAAQFVAARPAQIRAATARLHRAPSHDAPVETEALFGEQIRLFEIRDGWAWIQLNRDNYVGYVSARQILVADVSQTTHEVRALRTFLYKRPDFKSSPDMMISMTSELSLAARQGPFRQLDDGRWIIERHVRTSDQRATDYVAVAEAFVGTPYLWAGRTSLGLDCSALVQLALRAAGIRCPRDSDMQAKQVGTGRSLSAIDQITRGDLVFWRGHVGIMVDPENLLHANAYHMMVVIEPLADARARIDHAGEGEPVAIRRIADGGAAEAAAT